MPSALSDSLFQPPPELAELWNATPEIVKIGNPVLRQVAKPIERPGPELRALAERMVTIMRKANGLGLAAPQVGVPSRLFVYDLNDGKGVRVLVNPQITESRGEQLDPPEGCLSIPGLQGQVKRAMEVRVRAFDARGRKVSIRATGLEARVIQHEYDHLDGVLFTDKADPETLKWTLNPEDEEEETI